MAAGSTYVPLATTTLGSAQTSYTFSSIAGTYTDLKVIVNSGVTTGPDDIRLRFNGDTTTIYSSTLLRGDGSSAISARSTADPYIIWMGYMNASSIGSVSTIDIMNYANTTTYKTALNRGSAASSFVNVSVGLWRSTAAITSITLVAGSSTFIAGSTFTLWGILNA